MAFGVPLDEVPVVRAEPEEDGVDALADLDELVLVLRAGEREVELEVVSVPEARAQHPLDAGVGYPAEVFVAAGGAAGRRQVAEDERVVRGLVVPRELEVQAVFPEAGVEAQLELLGLLGLEVRVAHRSAEGDGTDVA